MNNRPFTAKMSGACDHCTVGIRPGERIASTGPRYHFAHVTCPIVPSAEPAPAAWVLGRAGHDQLRRSILVLDAWHRDLRAQDGMSHHKSSEGHLEVNLLAGGRRCPNEVEIYSYLFGCLLFAGGRMDTFASAQNLLECLYEGHEEVRLQNAQMREIPQDWDEQEAVVDLSCSTLPEQAAQVPDTGRVLLDEQTAGKLALVGRLAAQKGYDLTIGLGTFFDRDQASPEGPLVPEEVLTVSLTLPDTEDDEDDDPRNLSYTNVDRALIALSS